MRGLIGLVGLAMASGVTAQGFDPRAHRAFPGPPSEVLVLGTPHLSGMPAAFKPADLAPLLDRLAAWKPEYITVEDVSGVQCDELRRFAALHSNAAETYCSDPTAAQRALGMDMTAATLAIAKTLGAWPKTPSAAERRHLAALFLAGGEAASALVQWLRLPAGERHAGDGLDAAMATRLTAAQSRRNESYLVAATLAARLGHERVYPVDDHTADDGSDTDDAYGKTVSAAWDNPATKARMAASETLTAGLGTPAATLALYQAYNRPSEADAAFASDFGAALAEPSAGRYGRRYVAWWEVRNLRMVANIRAVLQKHPGARLLAVVGASHKGYFQAYLSMMHDVRIADAEAVLR